MNSIGNFFNGCFSSYKIGHIKPESNFFEYIENELKLFPEKLLLIDDTQENIKSAQERGWNTYYYHDIESLKKFLSDINCLQT